MSTVSGSEPGVRASDTDLLRRTQSEAQQRESDLVKKQMHNVRRLNEAHYGEIERLKENHRAQINELHDEVKGEISARDHHNLKEIEDLRALHRREMQRLADESSRRESAEKNALVNNDAAIRKQSEERLEKLSREYRDKANELSEHYDEGLKVARDAQDTAVDRTRNQLESSRRSQTEDLRRDRDKKVAQISNEFSRYRGETEKGRQADDIHQIQTGHRASDELLHAVNKEREGRRAAEESLRQEYGDSLTETRDKFREAQLESDQKRSVIENDFRDSVGKRIDGQVRRLENEKRELAEAGVNERIKSGGQNRGEIRAVREQAKKNIDNYREQRDEAVAQANERVRHDVGAVREDLGRKLEERNHEALVDRAERQHDYERDVQKLRENYGSRGETVSSAADNRVRHILEKSNEERARLEARQSDETEMQQKLKRVEMRNLRESIEDDKSAAVGRVYEQMRRMESNHTEKTAQLISKYEKQVQALQDQIGRERKSNADDTKRLTEELVRVHKMEMDQLEAKGRARIREIATQHGEEVRTLNRRHDEKLDQVIGEMKRT